MPQPSFQPRIYAADSRVWYGEPPSAGKRGCAFTILLLIAIIWRDSIHHEIAKTAVIFFLLAFLVWVLLPGISTGHPLAVCDIEGLTFSCGKKNTLSMALARLEKSKRHFYVRQTVYYRPRYSGTSDNGTHGKTLVKQFAGNSGSSDKPAVG